MAIPLLPCSSPLWAAAPFQLNYPCFRFPYRTDLVAPIVFLITPRRGPSSKHTVSNNTSAVASVSDAKGTCLQSRSPEMAVVHFLILRSLHSNASTCHNIVTWSRNSGASQRTRPLLGNGSVNCWKRCFLCGQDSQLGAGSRQSPPVAK
jgi:hypothetical protein